MAALYMIHLFQRELSYNMIGRSKESGGDFGRSKDIY